MCKEPIFKNTSGLKELLESILDKSLASLKRVKHRLQHAIKSFADLLVLQKQVDNSRSKVMRA